MPRIVVIYCLATLAIALLLALAGCEMEVISEKSSFDWLTNHPELRAEGGHDDGRAMSYNHRQKRTGQNQAGTAPGGGGGPTAWSIRLARYEGPFRYDNANILLQRINEQSDLTELWVSDIDGSAAVYCGRFRDPESAQASNTLAKVQAMTLGNRQPFADADLYPLGGPSGSDGRGLNAGDPWDMAQYKGNYTVVINYYTPEFDLDGMDRYAAAEAAVKQLRTDGFPAYYWHHPKNSRVCVGNFTREQAWEEVPNPDDDYRSTIEAYSPIVEDIRSYFPQLSENGMSLSHMQDGQAAAPVAAPLSRVPLD